MLRDIKTFQNVLMFGSGWSVSRAWRVSVELAFIHEKDKQVVGEQTVVSRWQTFNH